MAESAWRLVARTPHATVLDLPVASLRVPTETGQVGLRPGAEPSLLEIEPGVVHYRQANGATRSDQFLGTAGGLLICDRNQATLLTPLAFVGADERDIIEQLDAALTAPDSELGARKTLSQLEGQIVNELRKQQLEGREPLRPIRI